MDKKTNVVKAETASETIKKIVKEAKQRVYGSKGEVEAGKAKMTFKEYDNVHRAGLGWRPGSSGDYIHGIVKAAKNGIAEKDVLVKFTEAVTEKKVKSDNPKARVARILTVGCNRGLFKKADSGLYSIR